MLPYSNEMFFQFYPVLMQLALEVCLKKVTEAEMEELELAGHLKTPGDKREGQVPAVYSRLYKVVKRAIETWGLRKPLLFESEGIDNRSVVALYRNMEVGFENWFHFTNSRCTYPGGGKNGKSCQGSH